jgi:hypothetical protein
VLQKIGLRFERMVKLPGDSQELRLFSPPRGWDAA